MKLNGNSKLVLAAVVPLVGAAVGFGILQSDVNHNRTDLVRVERRGVERDKELRDALQRIEDKLDDLIKDSLWRE